MSANLDPSWQGWLDDNIRRGCNPEELLGILLSHKFPIAAIRKGMGQHFPEHSSLLAPPVAVAANSDLDHEALTRIRITRLGPESGVARLDAPELQLYTMEQFMTDGECDKMVSIMSRKLRPSTLTTDEPDKYFRTSSTSDLSTMDDPFIRNIDEKIAFTIGIQLSYSEGIQAQRYEVGQEFKPHTDYFTPGTPEYEKFAGVMGQRTWTFMVYLNETARGGGTQFVNIHKTFYPKKGMAVIWNNLDAYGQVNPDTLHWGMQVEEGFKCVITKWFREKGKGPMFYS